MHFEILVLQSYLEKKDRDYDPHRDATKGLLTAITNMHRHYSTLRMGKNLSKEDKQMIKVLKEYSPILENRILKAYYMI